MTNTTINNGESYAAVRAKINQADAVRRFIAYGAINRGLNTPPVSPTDGDVYIVGTSPTGAWSGQPNKIAIRHNGTWVFEPSVDAGGTPVAIGAAHEGLSVYVRDEDLLYVWSGSAWASLNAPVDPEVVRDTVAQALVAGNGITITHDDPGNTITISAAPAVLTPEAYGALSDPFDMSGDTPGALAARIAANDAAFAAMAVAIGNVGSAATSRSMPRTVAFRPGAIYRTSQTVRFENSWIKIQGNGAAIRTTASGPALLISYADSVNNTHGCEINGLVIHGGTGANAHGIHCQSAPQLTVTNCVVRNLDDLTAETLPACGGDGILIDGCVAVFVKNNSVYRPGGRGIVGRSFDKPLVQTGTITCTTGSPTVTGVGTTFTTQTAVGRRIYNAAGTLIGQVQSIASNTSLTLTANAAVAVTAGGWRSAITAEAQGAHIEGNRVYFSSGRGILISEGGGWWVKGNDIEVCGGGVEVQSCYDFSVKDNYFEVNGTDIFINNTVGLVGSARTILGGRVRDNTCESTNSVNATAGADVIFQGNRFSGSVTIGSGMTRPVWGRQVEMTGALTISSTTAIREDLQVMDIRLGAIANVSNSGGFPINLPDGSVAVSLTVSTTPGAGSLGGRPLQKLIGATGASLTWTTVSVV